MNEYLIMITIKTEDRAEQPMRTVPARMWGELQNEEVNSKPGKSKSGGVETCRDLRQMGKTEPCLLLQKWTLSGGGMLDHSRLQALWRATCSLPQRVAGCGVPPHRPGGLQAGPGPSSSRPQTPLYPKASPTGTDQEDPGLRSQDPDFQLSGLSNALFSDVGMCI